MVFIGLLVGLFLGFFITICNYNSWWILYGPLIVGSLGFVTDIKQRSSVDAFNNS
jgi:hypothetical protein